MKSQKLLLSFLLLLASVSLSACTLKYNAPEDEARAACRAGRLAGTPISCETLETGSSSVGLVPVAGASSSWPGVTCDTDGRCFKQVVNPLGASSPSTGAALIVIVEGGTWEGNRANPGLSALYSSPDFPEALRPHIRMLLSNFVTAYLSRTIQNNGQKYEHIYYVKSDGKLKDIVLQTLGKATRLHGAVDLFTWGHGSPGYFSANPELKSGLENLTSDNVIQYAQTQMTALQRAKVRSIFQSNCYMLSAPAGGRSMFQAYQTVFPTANFYGGTRINFFPMHRDAVMFEEYYKTGNFLTAFNTATNLMNYSFNGGYRTIMTYPAVKGRGCVTILGIEKCKEQVQLTASTLVQSSMLADSLPAIHLAELTPVAPVVR